MPAPDGLHDALDVIFDAQRMTLVDGIWTQGSLSDETLTTAITDLITVPEDDIVACRGAARDLVAVIRGIEGDEQSPIQLRIAAADG